MRMSEPNGEEGSAPGLRRAAWVYLGCAALIAIIAFFDLSTDPEISLAVLYLTPVVLGAWFGGKTTGALFSATCAVVWFFEDRQEHQYTHPAAAYWEATARLATFLLVSYLISRLRTSIHREKRESAKVLDLNAGLERRVEERTRALESNLRELEGFTYTMAHDLRAPARAVHGFGEVLRQEYGEVLDAAAHDYLNRISTAGEHMDRLVLDLLSYARLIHRPVASEVVELRSLVEEVTSSISGELTRRGGEVLPDERYPSVRGERSLLQEALRRLVTNAIGNVDEGKAPRIEIRGDRHDGRIRIRVCDNGQRIPADLWERLFRPGERLRPGPGTDTGMSLAIAKKAAERMDGRVGTEPDYADGNCVWIDLPAA